MGHIQNNNQLDCVSKEHFLVWEYIHAAKE